MYGADTQQLRDLARVLAVAAENLKSMTFELTAVLERTGWRGVDAETLKSRWRSVNRARLIAAADQLEAVAETLRRNADDQDRASGAVGGDRAAVSGWVGTPRFVDEASVLQGAAYLASASVLNDFLQKFDLFTGTATDIIDLARTGLTASVEAFDWSGAGIGGLVSGADYLVNAATFGVGSSEAAASAVDGVISTAVAGLPGGGIAYMGGKVIGQVMWSHGLGDRIMSESFITDFQSDATTLMSDGDAALARGDFEEAIRLSEIARDEASRASEASSGFTGIANSTKSVFKTLFRR